MRPKRPTRGTCARRSWGGKSSRRRNGDWENTYRRREAASAMSNVAFKVGDLGDTMKTVEDVLNKRYEVSAGKARVAKDMVDTHALDEKESERKALEQNALAEFLASQ